MAVPCSYGEDVVRLQSDCAQLRSSVGGWSKDLLHFIHGLFLSGNVSALSYECNFFLYLDPCNTVQCSFYSTCVLTSFDTATCRCTPSSSLIPSTLQRTLCGSDGKLYVSKEEMQYESCRKQKQITVQEYKNCGKNLAHFSEIVTVHLPRQRAIVRLCFPGMSSYSNVHCTLRWSDSAELVLVYL